jgi:hypothetical protein
VRHVTYTQPRSTRRHAAHTNGDEPCLCITSSDTNNHTRTVMLRDGAWLMRREQSPSPAAAGRSRAHTVTREHATSISATGRETPLRIKTRSHMHAHRRRRERPRWTDSRTHDSYGVYCRGDGAVDDAVPTRIRNVQQRNKTASVGCAANDAHSPSGRCRRRRTCSTRTGVMTDAPPPPPPPVDRRRGADGDRRVCTFSRDTVVVQSC